MAKTGDKVTRRDFVKGAVAAGVAVGSFRILNASPKGVGKSFKVIGITWKC